MCNEVEHKQYNHLLILQYHMGNGEPIVKVIDAHGVKIKHAMKILEDDYDENDLVLLQIMHDEVIQALWQYEKGDWYESVEGASITGFCQEVLAECIQLGLPIAFDCQSNKDMDILAHVSCN